ncbi:MAG: hypothetical protein IKW21_04160 [Lachnospiraceae bacterium]|nr:hypothetical protein [Lachnospiraceae bacterium]
MKLAVKFSEVNTSVNVRFEEINTGIDADFGEVLEIEVSKDVPFYEGSYSVIPSVLQQVLKTKKQMMAEDVVIEEIPYFEVTNTANGITATIG